MWKPVFSSNLKLLCFSKISNWVSNPGPFTCRTNALPTELSEDWVRRGWSVKSCYKYEIWLYTIGHPCILFWTFSTIRNFFWSNVWWWIWQPVLSSKFWITIWSRQICASWDSNPRPSIGLARLSITELISTFVSGKPCRSHLLHLNSNQLDNSKPPGRRKRWVLEAEAKLPYDEPSNILVYPNRTRRPFTPIFDLNQPIDEELEMTSAVNRTTVDVSGLIIRNANKRLGNIIVDPKKTTCMLYLQADHQFFSKYGTEEACIEVMTRHVQRVNVIYRNTGKKCFLTRNELSKALMSNRKILTVAALIFENSQGKDENTRLLLLINTPRVFNSYLFMYLQSLSRFACCIKYCLEVSTIFLDFSWRFG